MCFTDHSCVLESAGSTVVGGIKTGFTGKNSLANQAIIDSGVELTIANVEDIL